MKRFPISTRWHLVIAAAIAFNHSQHIQALDLDEDSSESASASSGETDSETSLTPKMRKAAQCNDLHLFNVVAQQISKSPDQDLIYRAFEIALGANFDLQYVNALLDHISIVSINPETQKQIVQCAAEKERKNSLEALLKKGIGRAQRQELIIWATQLNLSKEIKNILITEQFSAYSKDRRSLSSTAITRVGNGREPESPIEALHDASGCCCCLFDAQDRATMKTFHERNVTDRGHCTCRLPGCHICTIRVPCIPDTCATCCSTHTCTIL